MSAIFELWLPILLSAVAVFVASSIVHMLLPIHKNDHKQLPNEGELLEAMRKNNLPQGSYMFPYCTDMKDLGNDEMLQKYQSGPVGFMTVMPTGTPQVGSSLVKWFLYSLTVSVFAAYVATFTLSDEANYMAVFRLTGTVAFMAYGWGEFISSIWKGQSWMLSLKYMFDGLLYALVTAGVFGTMW